jgi:hypothetical protein
LARSKVALIKTSPATVRRDTHAVMNLAGYRDVLAKDADTARKVTMHAFKQSLGILGTCIKEAPEFASRRRHTKPHEVTR